MNQEVRRSDVEHFRGLVAERIGLHFDDAKRDFLEEVLRRRLERTGKNPRDYSELLERGEGYREEIRCLAQELTVGETYFFRNADQFRALAGVALPERMRARAAERRIRVLSAGCASGEEPFTIAMIAREQLSESGPWAIEILAVDVNPAPLERAAKGRYAAWSLRETSEQARDRYFRADAREFVLDPEIRKMVTFEERNLLEEPALKWAPGSADVIFCRNVIMYFTPETMRRVVAGLSRCLAPGGFLFLGHAETLRGLSQDFHLCHTHGTFYYQKREAGDEPLLPARTDFASVAPPLAEEPPATSWVDTIRRASEHIEALASEHTRAPLASEVAVSPGSAARAAKATDVARAVDLLRQERFSEARVVLRDLPDESKNNPDVLLLRAVLQTHGGNLATAKETCAELLELDEMNAGAHYLMAICKEDAGEASSAVEHDRIATYLDPGFAMPRLHLGLMARRMGELEVARRELGHALVLLEREDSSRLLLFGGGFSRDALISLCRSALAFVGGGR